MVMAPPVFSGCHRSGGFPYLVEHRLEPIVEHCGCGFGLFPRLVAFHESVAHPCSEVYDVPASGFVAEVCYVHWAVLC